MTMLWKYILVNSNNLSHIGELSQARDKKLDVVLGRPGAATFSYPMNSDYAALINPFKTGIKAMLYNRNTAIWDCMWSGYVLPINEAVSNNRMSISCVGWLTRLGRRMVRRDKTYSGVDDGVIIEDLLAEMNANPSPGDGYLIPTPAGSTPNTPTWMTWGGVQPNEGVGGATAYVPTVRSKKVPKYSHVLPVVEELQQIENGGDIVVDPLTRVATWHRRYRRVKDDVVFGFQWGPQNVREFGRDIESDSQINYIVATGASGTTPQYAEDVAKQNEIGMLEENVVLSDVTDNNILLTYAGAEQIIRGNGHITYSVTPFPVVPTSRGNVPEPFIDYRLGDQVRLTAVHSPRINIRGQAIRIFGISISIDENGVATLGPLQVAP